MAAVVDTVDENASTATRARVVKATTNWVAIIGGVIGIIAALAGGASWWSARVATTVREEERLNAVEGDVRDVAADVKELRQDSDENRERLQRTETMVEMLLEGHGQHPPPAVP